MHHRATLVRRKLGGVLAQHAGQLVRIVGHLPTTNDFCVRPENLHDVTGVKIALNASDSHRQQARATASHCVDGTLIEPEHTFGIGRIQRPKLPR